jgi:hypothetical protein
MGTIRVIDSTGAASDGEIGRSSMQEPDPNARGSRLIIQKQNRRKKSLKLSMLSMILTMKVRVVKMDVSRAYLCL